MATTRESGQVLSQLQSMDSYDFEHLVADLWEQQGWDTEVSQASSDAGIDVIATKENPYPQKKLIQAKRYGPNTTVGSPDMQQYYSLKEQEDNVDSVVIVTSNEFTYDAEERAQELNVKTVNGDEMVELIDRLNSYDLLDQYDTSDVISGTASPTVNEAQSEDKSTDEGFWAGISNDSYYRFIQLGTAVWTFGFILGIAGYSGSGGTLDGIFGLVSIITWVVMPPGLYYEAQRVAGETDWTPYKTLYAATAVIPFLNALIGGIYLYRRKNAYERARPQGIEESGSFSVESADDSRESITERSE
ncbi:restriction endonuclease [Halococcus saccharolyticus]|uniref:Restriction endonuclease n=1 Tax=Halococcus saccharolyticus DSM 5350 TaxID=1227455 RepID=M0MIK7_9EURY|nr:restriction endonuclease [Halococcus saccharolyticus]EMA45496.1 restriction endonuclease [Halococcus saccharolyticus DSM 5350]